MIDRFLRAKHWQLFLLTFGLPMILQFGLMASMMVNLSSESKSDGSFGSDYLKYFPVVMILFMGVLFGWLWSVAIGLQKKVPDHVKMKVKKFKILFLIPVIYILLMSIFISTAMSRMFEGGMKPSGAFITSFVGILVPLHLFSMFCIFYSLYFVAKTFKTVELQRQVSFSDFAGEFFMIWFYPIGIWIVQPKINKMAV